MGYFVPFPAEQIADLQAEIGANAAAISANTAAISVLDGEVSTLQTGLSDLEATVATNATLAADAAAEASSVGTWSRTPRDISVWAPVSGWSFDAVTGAWTTSTFDRILQGWVPCPAPISSIRLLIRDRVNPTPPAPGRGALTISTDRQLPGIDTWTQLVADAFSAGDGTQQEVVIDTSGVSPTLFPLLIRVTVLSGDAVGAGSPWTVYQAWVEV